MTEVKVVTVVRAVRVVTVVAVVTVATKNFVHKNFFFLTNKLFYFHKIFFSMKIFTIFLAAPRYFRSLVIGRSVRWSVGWSVNHLCEKVTFKVQNGKVNLPTYLPLQQ